MRDHFSRRRGLEALAVLLCGAALACNAGLVTEARLTGGADSGPDGSLPPSFSPSATPNSPPTQDQDAARGIFERQVLPRLLTECGSCHVETSAPFLAGGDPYATVLAWPGLVTAGQPEQSALVTKGAHDGPALNPVSEAQTRNWILALRQTDGSVPPTSSDPTPTLPPGENALPLPVVDAQVEAGTHTVTFDASRSSDPDGVITSYRWRFGDGESSREPTTTHRYPSAGTYEVRLTVTDDDGARSWVEMQVVVADDSGGPTDIAIEQLLLVDTATGRPLPELAPFGNGFEVNLEELGGVSLSVQALTGSRSVVTVRFQFDGGASVDQELPFLVPMALSPGAHSVTATPLDAAAAEGTATTVDYLVR